ncbi:AraC family transcriptional regulator [Mycobacterium sp.]|uniref:AraC family transcriptional regulator n=1 Tax=Mycobacterium sp. TaxID=1785 RepID=UPI0025D07C6B|nr:AraC family transcriptional regulator [Mycobacterium sp.]
MHQSLSSTGLTLDDLSRSDLQIAAGDDLTIIRNVLRRAETATGLGIEAGCRMTLGMLGVWGYAMLNSPTLRDAIQIGVRYGYGKLSFVFSRPRVDYGKHEARLVLDCAEVPHDVRNFVIERDLAAQASVIHRLLGKSARVPIETTLGRLAGQELAAALTPMPVESGLPHNVIRIPNGLLDVPLPQSDPFAAQMWTERCQELVRRHHLPTKGTDVAAKVRAALRRDPGRIPSLDEVSANFNVTSRTLRRQLAAEGAGFRELVDDVRKVTAMELLAAGQSVNNVAREIGFAESASFIRAYKRWTGATPGALSRANTVH